MKYKDYYKILGLDTTRVTVEEIKSAYRAAVKRNHPDLNVDDNLAEEKIKDINEAYKTLSIPASKRKYDRIWNSRNNVNNYQKFKGKNIFNMFLGDIPKDDEERIVRKTPLKGENIETEIRVLGQGKKGINGGKNGDLLIKINIEDSKMFKLYGSDLCTDLKLTPWEAALGTRVDVKTIDGETKVYIPQGIQSGEKLRISSKGYKDGKGGRGDLVAEVKIMVPKKLELDEKEMFERLKDMSTFNPRND